MIAVCVDIRCGFVTHFRELGVRCNDTRLFYSYLARKKLQSCNADDCNCNIVSTLHRHAPMQASTREWLALIPTLVTSDCLLVLYNNNVSVPHTYANCALLHTTTYACALPDRTTTSARSVFSGVESSLTKLTTVSEKRNRLKCYPETNIGIA